MIARRLAGSFLSKMRMQKLSTSAELVDPNLSKIDLGAAMRKQNEADLVLVGKVISSKARNSNFIFSPASLNAVVTMNEAANAASEQELKAAFSNERKAVYSKLANVVFANGSTLGGPKIKVVNGFWVEQSLPVNLWLKDFMEDVFKTTITPVDFRSKAEQVRVELNKWVSNNTNGLIKDLLPQGSVTNDTNQVYGNALYFKGAWEHEFQKSMTRDQKFHLLSGTTVSVPFMSSGSIQYIRAYDGFKVLKLPFRQGRDMNRSFSMHFYLPDEKDGLYNLVKKMTSTPGFVDKHIPSCKCEVGIIRIPKFKISFMFEASRFFKGVDSKAFYHKACVEIDEKGAEAAAGSFVSLPISMVLNKIDFVADHPFLFLIREDETGTILFAGQIFDPSKSS